MPSRNDDGYDRTDKKVKGSSNYQYDRYDNNLG